jgi:UDP-N-acetylmuramoyl-L-alanyl-D-glutamate--2,6-diaminopimelate ligase
MSITLGELAADFDIRGDVGTSISDVTEDSRQAGQGSLFVAVPGTADDGHKYVADAIARGASAIAVERLETRAQVPTVMVPSARKALATFAQRLYGNPASGMQLVGFTGTFGKTTTSQVLQLLLNAAGCRTAVIGSLGAKLDDVAYELRGMTTPSPVLLQRALRLVKDAGATTVVLEVTSHALRQDRVHGLQFGGGLYAAIRPGEHIDFHRGYEDYVDAKRLLLNYLSPGAILAYDADNRAAAMLARERPDVRSVGFSLRRTPVGDSGAKQERREANLQDRRLLALTDATLDDRGAVLSVDGIRLRSALLGRANLRNVALALTYARQYGLRVEAARGVLAALKPLRRRMERYEVGGRVVLDDTAGHPESFDATFEVADLIPASRIVVAYALRGRRGADINRRNALSLSEHVQALRASRFVVTEASDTVTPLNRVEPDERDAAAAAFRERGISPSWHESMSAAMRDVAAHTGPGDLIVLVGAQGMDAGREELGKALA